LPIFNMTPEDNKRATILIKFANNADQIVEECQEQFQHFI